MKKEFKIISPRMPNYAFLEIKPRPKQDGFQPNDKIDIADFTEEEALEFAILMKEEFLAHYRRRKKERTETP